MTLFKANTNQFDMGRAVSNYPVVTNDISPARFKAQEYSFDRGFALVFEIDGKERRFDANGRHKKVGSSLTLHMYRPNIFERLRWAIKPQSNPFK
jgi:hypothetical protein